MGGTKNRRQRNKTMTFGPQAIKQMTMKIDKAILMFILCPLILLFSIPIYAAQLRDVTGGGIETKDKSAINTNFKKVNNELSNAVHKTGTETIRGVKTFESGLIVPDGSYLQIKDSNAGAPPAGDCDNDSEMGRMSIDTTNERLYICNGATRAWDYIALTD